MRTLKIMQHISLDGVIQHSDDGDGFPYSDWSAPYRSAEGREVITATYGAHFDLLLGRRTYDIWSGYWPKAPSSPLANAINAATKYVATHHSESLHWGPAQALGGDLVQDVRRIKAQDGPTLFLCGSSTLTSTLLEHGLADEVLLVVSPILLGTGKCLFKKDTPARAFELLSSQSFPSGVVFSRYRTVRPAH